ncbi:MAG: endopeptidase La [Spirochaetales bacterium]|nr:endopeptidase La [Spirochaetales bacterium]
MENKSDINKSYVISIEGTVIFPRVATSLKLSKSSGEVISHLFNNGIRQFAGLTLKQGHSPPLNNPDNYYNMGVLLQLSSIQPASDKGFILDVESTDKIVVTKLTFDESGITAEFNKIEEIIDLDTKSQSEMIAFIKSSVQEISKNFHGSEPFIKPLLNLTSIDELIGYILPYLPASVGEKQELFEVTSLRDKCIKFIDMLLKQKESIHLQIEMAKKFSEQNNKNYRKNLLREQLKAIQDELNEGTTQEDGKSGYKEKIEAAHMPPDVEKVAYEELGKLEAMERNNPEGHIIRNYLDLLVALPWTTTKKQSINMEAARAILDSGHYGLDDVKDRIIQHLAVMKLKEEKQGSILLLIGPPGTGKTSLGKQIAEALGRKYVRASLGGIRDEAEIRGHRRTYIGALPGRIIQGIKKAGEKNPVFVLDEVDKLAASYAGDPASALLEVLDPEQNNSFADHYLEVPYDLSDVFFIATANTTNSIPAPLLDRMEVIYISGYTNNEKIIIGKKHLFPKSLEEHGLNESKLKIEENAIETIIEKYTREAGVRSLKKQMDKIARVASEKIVSGKVELPWSVTRDMLHDILGKELFHHDDILKDQVPGVVTGLAWTPVGGEILFVEGTFMPGKGDLTLTGQLGDVMKESARISLSLIRSRLAHYIKKFDFIQSDIHIHVPSGATPKDGPSAGIALFTTLASLLLGKKVDTKLAMTGEITLRGSVLPVGGIKEKLLAAHRAGITKVILPKDNEKDVEDIPKEIRDELQFVFVESVEQVLKEALAIDLPVLNVIETFPDFSMAEPLQRN